MNETLRLHGVAAAVALLIATGASAQNLTITNARIIDGTGKVIDRGAVVVKDGKIASVSAAAPAAAGGRTIDAGGKTVMPGLIDAHRHIVTGGADWLDKTAPKEMQEFLDAGFTTLLCALEPQPAVGRRTESTKVS
jgi:imidazolonepropionase-like amidohydrolase